MRIRTAASIAALAALCCAADIKFSALPLVSAIGGTERMVSLQGAGCPTGAMPCNNVAITPGQLASYVASSTAITGGYQPLDPDLTSLAAAGSTGSIYYRASAGTWSPVSLGTHLSLTSGTLDTLGFGTIATQDASSVAITGGSASLSSLDLTSTPPATSSDACAAGQITWDAGYLYVCTAANSWKRAALSTF